jgi:hypothetical protein
MHSLTRNLSHGQPCSESRGIRSGAGLGRYAATELLLDGAEHAADASAGPAGAVELAGQSRDLALHRAEIDQATGMLTSSPGAFGYTPTLPGTVLRDRSGSSSPSARVPGGG